jgi:hypothetical protein
MPNRMILKSSVSQQGCRNEVAATELPQQSCRNSVAETVSGLQAIIRSMKSTETLVSRIQPCGARLRRNPCAVRIFFAYRPGDFG